MNTDKFEELLKENYFHIRIGDSSRCKEEIRKSINGNIKLISINANKFTEINKIFI